MANPRTRQKEQFYLSGPDSASFGAGTANAPGSVPARSKVTSDEIAIFNELPAVLPVQKTELALLRAFLADEIDAILRSGD